MNYIIIALALLGGKYVDMPMWQLIIITVATVWAIRQLEGGEWR